MNALFRDKERELCAERWFRLYHHETCTLCGSHFGPMGMAYMAKDDKGNLQRVCKSCLEKVNKLHCDGNKHIWKQQIPEPSAKLWKFIDLAKFVGLISTRKMHFTRLTDFPDIYEGAICSMDAIEKFNTQDTFVRRILTAADMKRSGANPTEEEVQQKTKESRAEFDKNRNAYRQHVYVSCWSKNEVESEAMWRLYAKDLTCGIAIQSSFERLFKSMDNMSQFEIGEVNYVNYDEDFVSNCFESVWYKRKSLEYEHEVRAVLEEFPNHSSLFSNEVDVNVDDLIENIVLSPEAQPWFFEVVKDLCKKYGVCANIKQSDINKAVYY